MRDRLPGAVVRDLMMGSAGAEVQQRRSARIAAELRLLWEQLLASGHAAAAEAHSAARSAGALAEQLRQPPAKMMRKKRRSRR